MEETKALRELLKSVTKDKEKQDELLVNFQKEKNQLVLFLCTLVSLLDTETNKTENEKRIYLLTKKMIELYE